MVRQLENYVVSLIRAAADRDKEFLNLLFSDLYDARRQYWIQSLYHNPVIIGGVLGTLFLSVTAHLPYLPTLTPWLVAIRDAPWIQFVPLQGTVVYCAFKLMSLNPRDQFIPPRLSAAGVHAEVREVASGIGQSLGESTAGGAAAGVILGAYAAHPLLGLAAGILLGLLTGEDLDKMKQRVSTDLKQRLEFGVQQLNDRILAWIDRQKVVILKEVKESFRENFSRVRQFLVADREFGQHLASESRLLLEGPAASPRQIARRLPASPSANRANLPEAVGQQIPAQRRRSAGPSSRTMDPAAGNAFSIHTVIASVAAFAFGLPLVWTLALYMSNEQNSSSPKGRSSSESESRGETPDAGGVPVVAGQDNRPAATIREVQEKNHQKATSARHVGRNSRPTSPLQSSATSSSTSDLDAQRGRRRNEGDATGKSAQAVKSAPGRAAAEAEHQRLLTERVAAEFEQAERDAKRKFRAVSSEIPS
jgi:hypothetical protein